MSSENNDQQGNTNSSPTTGNTNTSPATGSSVGPSFVSGTGPPSSTHPTYSNPSSLPVNPIAPTSSYVSPADIAIDRPSNERYLQMLRDLGNTGETSNTTGSNATSPTNVSTSDNSSSGGVTSANPIPFPSPFSDHNASSNIPNNELPGNERYLQILRGLRIGGSSENIETASSTAATEVENSTSNANESSVSSFVMRGLYRGELNPPSAGAANRPTSDNNSTRPPPRPRENDSSRLRPLSSRGEPAPQGDFRHMMLQMVRGFAETVFEDMEDEPPPKPLLKCPVCNFAHEEVALVNDADDEDEDEDRPHRTANFQPQPQHALSHGARMMFIQLECPVSFEMCGPPVVGLPCGHCISKETFEGIGGRIGEAAFVIPEPPPRPSREMNPLFRLAAGARGPDADPALELYSRLMSMEMERAVYYRDEEFDDDSAYRAGDDDDNDDEEDEYYRHIVGERMAARRRMEQRFAERRRDNSAQVEAYERVQRRLDERNREPAGRLPWRETSSSSSSSSHGELNLSEVSEDEHEPNDRPPWLASNDTDDDASDSGPPPLVPRNAYLDDSSSDATTPPLPARRRNDTDDSSSSDDDMPALIERTFRYYNNQTNAQDDSSSDESMPPLSDRNPNNTGGDDSDSDNVSMPPLVPRRNSNHIYDSSDDDIPAFRPNAVVNTEDYSDDSSTDDDMPPLVLRSPPTSQAEGSDDSDDDIMPRLGERLDHFDRIIASTHRSLGASLNGEDSSSSDDDDYYDKHS